MTRPHNSTLLGMILCCALGACSSEKKESYNSNTNVSVVEKSAEPQAKRKRWDHLTSTAPAGANAQLASGTLESSNTTTMLVDQDTSITANIPPAVVEVVRPTFEYIESFPNTGGRSMNVSAEAADLRAALQDMVRKIGESPQFTPAQKQLATDYAERHFLRIGADVERAKTLSELSAAVDSLRRLMPDFEEELAGAK
jgi:hypothetical protein